MIGGQLVQVDVHPAFRRGKRDSQISETSFSVSGHLRVATGPDFTVSRIPERAQIRAGIFSSDQESFSAAALKGREEERS